jgi:hypothetical protein
LRGGDAPADFWDAPTTKTTNKRPENKDPVSCDDDLRASRSPPRNTHEGKYRLQDTGRET